MVNETNICTNVEAIIKPLIYFNIFNHPLTLNEIHKYSPVKCSINHVKDCLNDLVDQKMVFDLEGYFSLTNDANHKKNRLTNQKMANDIMPFARQRGRMIARFPFVSSVCISGSLSKDVMTEDGDIDFFVICKKDRIWVSKLLLIFYRKLFLFNSAQHFCLNYFISEENLEIREHNLFTSIELVTLKPIVNTLIYKRLLNSNEWIKRFLPNNVGYCSTLVKEINSKPVTTKIIETLLNGWLGDRIDDLVLYLYRGRVRRRYRHSKNPNFKLMFRSTKIQSKIHASDHQNVIMTKYLKGCREYNLNE